MNKLYFAYGANLNVDSMRQRCPLAAPLYPFELIDWQLNFSGVATITPCPGARVPGALWQLTADCEASLDVFEGYPDFYRKEYLTVSGVDVMVYIMNNDPPAPPGPGYLATIAAGYRDWGLDSFMLDQAVERSHNRHNIANVHTSFT